MKNAQSCAALAAVFGMALAGCGGSGSDPERFTSFKDVPANGTTIIKGTVITGTYTANLVTGDIAITSTGDPVDGTTTLTTRSGDTVAIEVSGGGSSVSFGPGDTIFCDAGVCALVSSTGQDLAFFGDADFTGFDFQTFGTWLTGYGTTSGDIGVGTFGALTAAADMPAPIMGTVTYDGFSMGLLQGADDQPYFAASDITVSTNFTTATVTSSGTNTVNLVTSATSAAPDLDFSATGAISGNGFSGPIAGPTLSGTLDGWFYGPNAEEVGGVFEATGGGYNYIGAFGAN